MSRLFVLPYHMRNGHSKRLSRALGGKRVYHDRNYKPWKGDWVINWGSSTIPGWFDQAMEVDAKVMNFPSYVATSVNKTQSFIYLEGYANIPTYTTDGTTAMNWVADGHTVVVRKEVSGKAGEGVHFIDENTDLVQSEADGLFDAPLFTIYEDRTEEYRVHIINGDVIDVTQKKLRNGTERTDDVMRLRNHNNGWVFARKDINIPPQVLEESLKAVSALGLDFGAVDVGWNGEIGRAVVFEVNTAPALKGTTLYRYAKRFSEITGAPLLLEKPESLTDDMQELY